MSLRDWVHGLNEQFGTDDAPLWAEVLGPLLVIGLLYRNVIHIYTALGARGLLDEEISPQLAAHDLTLQSPVVDLRGRPVERVARLGSFVFGLGAWLLLVQGAVRPAWVTAFVVANVAVLLGDPLAFAIDRARRLTHRTRTNTPTANAD